MERQRIKTVPLDTITTQHVFLLGNSPSSKRTRFCAATFALALWLDRAKLVALFVGTWWLLPGQLLRIPSSEVEYMIGLVLVTHGNLAEEFRSALEHVVGPLTGVATVSIGPEDDMEQRRQDIVAAVDAADAGQGVVIATDMFGGTPSNLAISIMEPGRIEVIAGANLPMLVKFSSVRDELSIAEAIEEARLAGRKYISVASQVLAGHKD